MKLSDSMSLGEARDWLRRRLRRGAKCPLCHRYDRIYTRGITDKMAQALIIMHRNTDGWHHTPSLLAKHPKVEHGDWAKLRYWGLIEEHPNANDGKAGHWRITKLGRRFVKKKVRVREYAMVYHQRFLGFGGGEVDIIESLGAKFDYDELMRR